MTCHVTNQINQHMSERDNDEALTIEALRDKCDEMEDAIAGFAQLVGESSNECVAMLKGVESRYIALEAERDRLQSTVAALERERDELSEDIESIHELIDAHYGLSVRETSMECLKPRVLQLIKEKSELRSQLANCCQAIRFEFKMNGIVACLHKALLHAEAFLAALAEPKEKARD